MLGRVERCRFVRVRLDLSDFIYLYKHITKKERVAINAQYILDNCELLIKSDCIVVDDIVYEYCRVDNNLYDEEAIRYFVNEDEYDYIEDEEIYAKLRAMFVDAKIAE